MSTVTKQLGEATLVTDARVEAFTIPTPEPESDGTLEWSSTTMVVVELHSDAEVSGLGYTYAHAATARLIADELIPLLRGRDAMAIESHWLAMRATLRNHGTGGLAAMAISAVDIALWDLKARLLGLPLWRLLGAARARVPVYGSGGFTSYSDARLADEIGEWRAQGIADAKIKVGREPVRDLERVRAARAAMDGTTGALMVDANGAYTFSSARRWARVFQEEAGVSWLEEPLPAARHADLTALRLRLPPGVELAGGEYLYDPAEARLLLDGPDVDVLMADVTRCSGITGFLQIAALAAAAQHPLSTHCAPALHAPLGGAEARVRHVEYFQDHARIERALLDGFSPPAEGTLAAGGPGAGHGYFFKWRDAQRYAA